VSAFTGDNYQDLAKRFKVSDRYVRSVIEKARKAIRMGIRREGDDQNDCSLKGYRVRRPPCRACRLCRIGERLTASTGRI
jgi:hypothetical protein